MKINKIWLEHIISVVLVSVILIVLILYFNDEQKHSQATHNKAVEKWLNLSFLDFDDPMHKTILEESLNIFDSLKTTEHAELIRNINRYRQQQILDVVNSQAKSPINFNKVSDLFWMYLKFIFVFLVTIIITYYCVQTLGVYRFILFKRKQLPYFEQLVNHIKNVKFTKWQNLWGDYYPVLLLLLKTLAKAIFYMVLFSPAYVLAYSFKTKFDTDMLIFMVLLGVISNAVLITYANKFYTFLISESRKGYVETAIAKNLYNSYKKSGKDGISLKKIFLWKKSFPGHVLEHIYQNARFQYLATIKEQASFLITGLIIIEMALNIQNHLCYELLQNILYANYAVVTLIVLAIFYLVKSTEVFVDYILVKEASHYNLG